MFVSPEEIQLFSWADFKEGIFAAHHYSESYRTPQRTPTWTDVGHALPSPRRTPILSGEGRVVGTYAVYRP